MTLLRQSILKCCFLRYLFRGFRLWLVSSLPFSLGLQKMLNKNLARQVLLHLSPIIFPPPNCKIAAFWALTFVYRIPIKGGFAVSSSLRPSLNTERTYWSCVIFSHSWTKYFRRPPTGISGNLHMIVSGFIIFVSLETKWTYSGIPRIPPVVRRVGTTPRWPPEPTVVTWRFVVVWLIWIFRISGFFSDLENLKEKSSSSYHQTSCSPLASIQIIVYHFLVCPLAFSRIQDNKSPNLKVGKLMHSLGDP